ncbi:hypothetical protein SAMN03159306_06009 [Pseudomonas sp. NFACC48-1]|nr:hypothetical protein SAMN03159424_05579 [Pseudomonas sp. NFACC05-1]SCZ46282.1 hypothetical protein SAMN03159405_05627 [Pseudomonas sp. NFACC44-2]SDA86140.1 hypothetical protein SAMN03159429_04945 [Pseudomonas sp. NFACC51]SDY60634.1 hypothetical protein SAMN03159474_05848 [Pseudomonas sp. NFACC08-1]SEI82749.1 hypothetical protein SAMN03159298_01553 [Pseudomonas sp. NFACC07-1]SFJ16698.1 hypothetical protein SAMN03159302_05421 [Pseudomonas sp. NFACC54]SFL46700.1 hypothetical protein SAMN03159
MKGRRPARAFTAWAGGRRHAGWGAPTCRTIGRGGDLTRNRLTHIIVARELAPAGLRSSPKSPHAVSQTNSGSRFQDCCAAQREQAPSPQKRIFRRAVDYKSRATRKPIQSPRSLGTNALRLPERENTGASPQSLPRIRLNSHFCGRGFNEESSDTHYCGEGACSRSVAQRPQNLGPLRSPAGASSLATKAGLQAGS